MSKRSHNQIVVMTITAVVFTFALISSSSTSLNAQSMGNGMGRPGMSGGGSGDSCTCPEGTRWNAGKQKCESSSGKNCPSVYNPVCGCDGKTYSNECVAVITGRVKSLKAGACTGGGNSQGDTGGSQQGKCSKSYQCIPYNSSFNCFRGNKEQENGVVCTSSTTGEQGACLRCGSDNPSQPPENECGSGMKCGNGKLQCNNPDVGNPVKTCNGGKSICYSCGGGNTGGGSGEKGGGTGDFGKGETECARERCGTPLGMPSWTCEDGSKGGNTGRCLLKDGKCRWEVKECKKKGY